MQYSKYIQYLVHNLLGCFLTLLFGISVNYGIFLQVSAEFEELIANLKISKDPEPAQHYPHQEPKSQSGEPLSPQSFAMVSNP